MEVKARRIRLPAKEAKRRILEAAERQLIEGGPQGVRVQTLARSLGITDAAVYHHFGNRDGLLTELLRFGGRRIRGEIQRVLSTWDGSDVDLEPLVTEILKVLDEQGYARLALWLEMAGYENRGRGLFDEFVELVNQARCNRGGHVTEEETRRRVALFAASVFSEPILGDHARRSASLATGRRATEEYRRWLARTFRSLMLAPEPMPS